MTLIESKRAEMLQAHDKMYQQAGLNETIRLFNQHDLPQTYYEFFYSKENQLLAEVKNGNTRAAKAMLKEHKGHVIFFEGGNIDAVKVRAVELTALLSRVALGSGAKADGIYDLNGKYINLLYQQQNLDDLCYLLQKNVECFVSVDFSENEAKDARICKALQYINDNYTQKISLESYAKYAEFSPNHFPASQREYISASIL